MLKRRNLSWRPKGRLEDSKGTAIPVTGHRGLKDVGDSTLSRPVVLKVVGTAPLRAVRGTQWAVTIFWSYKMILS
jgi:hypothetical protein